MLIIETKGQLKKAIKDKEKEFIVIGDLALQVYKTRKIKNLSEKSAKILALTLGSGIALSPFTGGASMPISAALTAAEITAIGGVAVALLAVSLGGIAVIYALHKGYEVEYENQANGSSRAKYTRK